MGAEYKGTLATAIEKEVENCRRNVGKTEVRTKDGLERIGDIVRKTLKISRQVRRWRRLGDMEGTD
jgi:hypothetical protein